jgi:hypothetical protein
MQLKNGNFCPFIKDNCKGLDCVLFTQVRGVNPNSGKEVDEYACAVAWLPLLLIENSQQQRQTGAAVESFRNEMVKSNEISQQVLLSTVVSNNQGIKVIEVKECV